MKNHNLQQFCRTLIWHTVWYIQPFYIFGGWRCITASGNSSAVKWICFFMDAWNHGGTIWNTLKFMLTKRMHTTSNVLDVWILIELKSIGQDLLPYISWTKNITLYVQLKKWGNVAKLMIKCLSRFMKA